MELTYYEGCEWHQSGNGQGYSYHDPQKLTLDPHDYDTAEDFIVCANGLEHTRLDVNLQPKEYDNVSPMMAKRLAAFNVGDLKWISEGMTVDVARVLAHRCGFGRILRGPSHLDIQLPPKNQIDEIHEYSTEVLWHLMLLLPTTLYVWRLKELKSMDHWLWKAFCLLRFGRRTMPRVLTDDDYYLLGYEGSSAEPR
ncbi:MAG: hypothetical protein HOO67_04410 [Candidatus Peribacteraceae bacterium]|nr:hypothetical protein [Candidatus Peribacteraceae bacterium]